MKSNAEGRSSLRLGVGEFILVSIVLATLVVWLLVSPLHELIYKNVQAWEAFYGTQVFCGVLYVVFFGLLVFGTATEDDSRPSKDCTSTINADTHPLRGWFCYEEKGVYPSIMRALTRYWSFGVFVLPPFLVSLLVADWQTLPIVLALSSAWIIGLNLMPTLWLGERVTDSHAVLQWLMNVRHMPFAVFFVGEIYLYAYNGWGALDPSSGFTVSFVLAAVVFFILVLMGRGYENQIRRELRSLQEHQRELYSDGKELRGLLVDDLDGVLVMLRQVLRDTRRSDAEHLRATEYHLAFHERAEGYQPTGLGAAVKEFAKQPRAVILDFPISGIVALALVWFFLKTVSWMFGLAALFSEATQVGAIALTASVTLIIMAIVARRARVAELERELEDLRKHVDWNEKDLARFEKITKHVAIAYLIIKDKTTHGGSGARSLQIIRQRLDWKLLRKLIPNEGKRGAFLSELDVDQAIERYRFYVEAASRPRHSREPNVA